MNTEAKVKEWLDKNRSYTWALTDLFDIDDLADVITSCINDLTPGVQEEWISGDIKPEEDEAYYLVCNRAGGVGISFYNHYGIWVDNEGDDESGFVAHWKPMPKAPTK